MNKQISIFIAAILIIASSIALLVLTRPRADQNNIRIREIRTYKFVTPSWCFVFEDPEDPGLARLIERENLKGLVKGAETEFEQVLLVKKWVHEQLKKAGDQAPGIIWNAAEILDLVRSNKMRALCGQHGVVFAQILTGLGITVRYIDLRSPKLSSHFLTEIWSRDYKKWVIVDPFYDLYYERNGVPLGVYELHQAYQNNNVSGCKAVYPDGKKSVMKDDLELYYKFGVVFRNNQLTDPPLVYFVVENSQPGAEIRPKPTWDDFILKYAPAGPYAEEKLFNWVPDITVIKVKNIDQRRGLVTLEFRSLTGEGKDFTVLTDNKISSCGQEFRWVLKKGGYNKLTVFPRHREADTQTSIIMDW